MDRLAADRGIEAGALELGTSRVVPATARATAERRSLKLHGIPVRGAFETSWRTADGAEQIVAARYPNADADLRPEHARVAAHPYGLIPALHPLACGVLLARNLLYFALVLWLGVWLRRRTALDGPGELCHTPAVG